MARRGPRRRSRLRSVLGWGALVLALVLLGGAAAAYHYDLLDRWRGTPSDDSAAPPVPGLTLPAVPTPRPVARPAPGGRPLPGSVRRALGPALKDPRLADLRAVVSPLTGPPALDLGHGVSMPASTLKLLTTTAALAALGPDHTFATRVVQTRRTAITLVGGGDPYLDAARPTTQADRGDASLQDLAARTARALEAKGISRVVLSYDTSLFTGPAVSPTWPSSYVQGYDTEVSPVTALRADEGRLPDGSRQSDPAVSAAEEFATYLRDDHITVGEEVGAHIAPAGASELARVTSRPLADIVERILQLSDNDGAEVLGHQTGLVVNGHGSFMGGAAAVRTTLTGLGIDLRGARLYDGSGLSRDDRVSVEMIASVLQLDSSADHPDLRAVVTGLPVAAFGGSLAERFVHSPGRGWVRAKTGTLTGTSGLAGVVTDARGLVLIFAFLSNHVPATGTDQARDALDHLAATLATCPC